MGGQVYLSLLPVHLRSRAFLFFRTSTLAPDTLVLPRDWKKKVFYLGEPSIECEHSYTLMYLIDISHALPLFPLDNNLLRSKQLDELTGVALFRFIKEL